MSDNGVNSRSTGSPKAGGSLDLSAEAEQQRLSGSALQGFLNLVTKWRVRDEDARELLGGMSSNAGYALEKHPNHLLEIDQIIRVSYLVGIYKALHLLYGDKLADEWVSLPNSNTVFGGSTPLQHMLCNGLTGIETVRKLLDARLEGGQLDQIDRSNEHPVLNAPKGIHHGG